MSQWACGSGDMFVGSGGESTNQAEEIRIELERVSFDGEILEEVVEHVLGFDVVTTVGEFLKTNARFRDADWTWLAFVPKHMETSTAYRHAAEAYRDELVKRMEALYRA